ncbi:hypothetical protein DEAC_c28100 [Desulfosporosinus acididurans]|uniref:Uncharacterized protein n=1 Tax=Desulfosporosinus acididurans TaxID=476652 RepID=A0A0J1FQK5_9FIRM|nr:hypothetical protein DEAC_c28100 [Desulfosporosinus acididurans]
MKNIEIDSTIYKTKPNKANRSKEEMDVYDLLERLDIPYFRLDHDETPSIEMCDQVERSLGQKIYQDRLSHLDYLLPRLKTWKSI